MAEGRLRALAGRVLGGPGATFSVTLPADRRLVALTFDDGPNPYNTLPLVEALASHDARATFFVVGSRIAERKAILAETARAGHEIGNHTFHHVRRRLPTQRTLVDELRRTQSEIFEVIGVQSRLVRPPFGKSLREYTRAAHSLGLRTVLWSIDPRDWDGVPAPSVVAHTLERVTPGAIVLMHDGGPLRLNVQRATSELVTRLTADGYELVTVSELLDAVATG